MQWKRAVDCKNNNMSEHFRARFHFETERITFARCVDLESVKENVVDPSDVGNCRRLSRELREATDYVLSEKKAVLRSEGEKIENISALEFGLTRSIEKETITALQIVKNDWLRFDKFEAAVTFIINSEVETPEIRKRSKEVRLVLQNLKNTLAHILEKNRVPVPKHRRYDQLKSDLDLYTRLFLEASAELTSEEEVEVSEKRVSEVRNFVILSELIGMCILFMIDLGHLQQ